MLVMIITQKRTVDRVVTSLDASQHYAGNLRISESMCRTEKKLGKRRRRGSTTDCKVCLACPRTRKTDLSGCGRTILHYAKEAYDGASGNVCGCIFPSARLLVVERDELAVLIVSIAGEASTIWMRAEDSKRAGNRGRWCRSWFKSQLYAGLSLRPVEEPTDCGARQAPRAVGDFGVANSVD
jgi:hypothetical protein